MLLPAMLHSYLSATENSQQNKVGSSSPMASIYFELMGPLEVFGSPYTQSPVPQDFIVSNPEQTLAALGVAYWIPPTRLETSCHHNTHLCIGCMGRMH